MEYNNGKLKKINKIGYGKPPISSFDILMPNFIKKLMYIRLV
jgi:hypothetical protein